ncbi:MAG: hypothetical protein A2Y38_26505 [Spirochaetes bacterium GWB1_59_5]|nr:MAG: hypothetical protein A2Y38_26505 [Spirochaetes bacterium GWB1_59_5]
MQTATERIKAVLLQVPEGRVASYGGVAALAGLPNGARMVARLLHSCSGADGLPWWRIVRADGGIALERGGGYEEQCARLSDEGIGVSGGRVDMDVFRWTGDHR